MSKYSVSEILKEMEKFTPKEGFNVVSVDDFAPVGEKLAMIKHCSTREEAEAVAAKHKDAVIYEPN